MTDEPQSAEKMSELRERWSLAKPNRNDFAAVVTDIKVENLVCETSTFERGPHVLMTHMGYFKPPTDSFLV